MCEIPYLFDSGDFNLIISKFWYFSNLFASRQLICQIILYLFYNVIIYSQTCRLLLFEWFLTDKLTLWLFNWLSNSLNGWLIIKFPPPRDGKGVKWLGYAWGRGRGGGRLKNRFDWYNVATCSWDKQFRLKRKLCFGFWLFVERVYNVSCGMSVECA